MHKAFFAGVCLGAMLVSVDSSAQALADVAKAEAARRKAQGKTSAKTYTNEDLKKDGSSAPAPAPAGDASGTPAAPASAGPAQTGSAAPASKPATTAGTPEKPAPPSADPPKDEKYWRNRITDARTALQRSQAFVDALQSHINGLYTEFVAMGDPIQRATIEKRRNEAIAEQDRVKADIVQQTKAIASIEEEARRASVPSGWLR
jgi:hypothetical protein